MGIFEKMFLNTSAARQGAEQENAEQLTSRTPTRFLSPEDVLKASFTPVRFSEGYDMDEVDAFLDHAVLPTFRHYEQRITRLEADLAAKNVDRDVWDGLQIAD